VGAARRTIFLTTAALMAAVVSYLVLTLPPRATRLDTPVPPNVVTGAYHVHSRRSDGTGSVDDIATAAAGAGLSFVILTDHGDGTRPPDPPTYRHGVLCIDAVELNTDAGHLVVLGLDRPAPYPLAGTVRDVIEDVHRLGGTAIAAHPDSPNARLRWRASLAGIDGIEWINLDSEWRDESPAALAGAALRALVRGPEVIASIAARPSRSLQRWDSAAAGRHVFGVAALDAHARIGLEERGESGAASRIAVPSYATMFRTIAESVLLDGPLSGTADDDARRILRALTDGRSFSVMRAFAAPAALEFTAEQGSATARAGGDLIDSGAPLVFQARVPGATAARFTLLRDGRPLLSSVGQLRLQSPAGPGSYRVEVDLANRHVPWIVSNPILVHPPDDTGGRGPDASMPVTTSSGATPLALDGWRIEREPASTASVTREGEGLRFDFVLAAGPPRGQYAAIAHDVDGQTGIERVALTARASRPMRISIQVRLPDGRGGQRWGRSVYVDTAARRIAIPLNEFDPIGTATSRRPIVAPVLSLLVVVDTVNARPSDAGTVWLSDVSLTPGHLPQ
jgi:hypothetical protein